MIGRQRRTFGPPERSRETLRFHETAKDEVDQPETEPVFDAARTRHQYRWLGSVFRSVARVFAVVKSPSPAEKTGALKAGSAAT